MKNKSIALVLPMLLAMSTACSDGGEDPQRDLYTSKQECLSDWGDDELCEPMNDAEMNEYRQHNDGFVFVHPYFFGPTYYSGDRSVMYKGRAIAPTTRNSKVNPMSISKSSVAASRPSVSSPRSVTFGGFGGKGSSVGS